MILKLRSKISSNLLLSSIISWVLLVGISSCTNSPEYSATTKFEKENLTNDDALASQHRDHQTSGSNAPINQEQSTENRETVDIVEEQKQKHIQPYNSNDLEPYSAPVEPDLHDSPSHMINDQVTDESTVSSPQLNSIEPASVNDSEHLQAEGLTHRADSEIQIISQEDSPKLESTDPYRRDTDSYRESFNLSYSEYGIDEGGGHFDLDSFDLIKGKKKHEHEYDKKFQTNGFVFLGRPNPNLGHENGEGHKKSKDKDKCQITLEIDQKFRVKIINGEFSKDAVISINEDRYSWSKLPDFSTVYSLSGIDDTIQMEELSIAFPLSKLQADGIRKTTPSRVKSNKLGPNRSRRHGALTIQIFHASKNTLLWEGSIYWHKKD